MSLQGSNDVPARVLIGSQLCPSHVLAGPNRIPRSLDSGLMTSYRGPCDIAVGPIDLRIRYLNSKINLQF
jgi:hypothetical protein